MKKIPKDIQKLLIEKVKVFNHPDFILNDPIQVPRQFVKKEDIEIAALLTATISWGNRTSIIKNAKLLLERMDNSPFAFVINASEKEVFRLHDFVHRTFNGDDLAGFLYSLKVIYTEKGGLESVFYEGYKNDYQIESSLIHFRQVFMHNIDLKRTGKHISDVGKGSSAKRLNMFLRWLVRKDDCGVDFGIWNKILPSSLMIPLDVHVGNVARSLGLLERKQNDWKSVLELTSILRKLDPHDPVKFDFALFGMGVQKKLV